MERHRLQAIRIYSIIPFSYSFLNGPGRYDVQQHAQEIEGFRTRLEGERTTRHRIFCPASSLIAADFLNSRLQERKNHVEKGMEMQ
ncbi:hypothetical protein [Paenibacillus dendritiformis]|uniref:hypothetical protein n=1 Tax=Paenibacillus dendritiformis TaxID=130049 RepID=UPI0020C4B727|nr:hypothetical protein [Paenibacillus dendritiformis]CAH8767439.1 hypothetical protein H7S4_000109 [Paenibacillus dendritiformis]